MRISLQELKAMAKDAKVKGYTKMTKKELIRELQAIGNYALILDFMDDYECSFEEAEDMARN